LETVVHQGPAPYITDFSMLNICSSSETFPSPRWGSAAYVVSRGIEILETKIVTINHILQFLILNY
jgi:hypothetical protein